jgi:hypothetical protein
LQKLVEFSIFERVKNPGIGEEGTLHTDTLSFNLVLFHTSKDQSAISFFVAHMLKICDFWLIAML